MREQGCLSSSAPSKSSRIKADGLTLCLNPQTLCLDRRGAQWYHEHKSTLETLLHARRCVPSLRRSSVCAQLEPKDAPKWSAGERSLDTNRCHLTFDDCVARRVALAGSFQLLSHWQSHCVLSDSQMVNGWHDDCNVEPRAQTVGAGGAWSPQPVLTLKRQ
jgi:hypothetical protein